MVKGLPFTKIYATIGPSTWDEGVLREMVANGLHVARINASFADAKEIERVTNLIRGVSPRLAVLVDTMGHKIRVTGFDEDFVIKEGQQLILASEKAKTAVKNVIRVTYDYLARDIKPGILVLIDDGNLQMVVDKIDGELVYATVTVGGLLKKRKTVNLPGVHLEFPSLPAKDLEDIKAAKDNNVDFIAASFVRNAEDVRMFRQAMEGSSAKLIAKIEDLEGVNHFDEILDLVDGIMIARGDLGVEEPIEKVPLYQKSFIKKCREKGKFSIVATQMMESMINNPRPTRAEVNDVATAVVDGADAVMLSAESSTGKYPVQAVSMMAKVARIMEPTLEPEIMSGRTNASEMTDMLAKHVPAMIKDLGLSAIVVITSSGKTVASLARHRLCVPIYAISTNPQLIRQVMTYRGVFGFYVKDLANDRDTALAKAIETVYSTGVLDFKDKVAVMSGSFIKGKKLNTILELVEVGEIVTNWSK